MIRTGLLLVFAMVLCAGCAGDAASPVLFSPEEESATVEARANTMLEADPAGPMPTPDIPEEIRHHAADMPQPPTREEVPYRVECLSPDAPELADLFMKAALLVRLQDDPVYSLTGLEQRLSASLDEAGAILRSQGYYAGRVKASIILPEDLPQNEGATPSPANGEADESVPDNAAPPAHGSSVSSPDAHTDSGRAPEELAEENAPAPQKTLVRIEFTPGPRYVMGVSSIEAVDPWRAPKPADDIRPLPASLEDVDLKARTPAVADEVLNSVDRVLEAFRNRGYPFATINSTRYTLDHEQQTLEADIRVSPGDFIRMGELVLPEDSPVAHNYFEALRPWRTGRPWSDRLVQFFRDSLQQSGLFQSIEIKPADVPGDDGETRPVLLEVVSAPERTVGGALKYDSEFGAGIEGSWEHRNLTGNADTLRIQMPIWQDMQELAANYRLPFFWRPDQDFIASGGLLNQDTDAYEIQAGAFSAGFERRFSRRWRATLQASVEGGNLKDPDEPKRSYYMLGLPTSVTYSTTREVLNATDGFRATLSVAPYTGSYDEDFNVLRSRADASLYLPVKGTEDIPDQLVVALRGSYGVLAGADAPDVPPSVRFYCGGGGSVRGYAYQSIGPRNDDNKPLGGSSLVEVSGELRWRAAQNWGLVAFVDGGTTFDGTTPDTDSTLRWGAGLGFRYYTAIGPVRLDVGIPLNPRSDDDSFQFYISIGQSF